MNAQGDVVSVVSSGVCIGCGACTAVADGISVKANPYGEFVAQVSAVSDESRIAASKVCPFSDLSEDESVLARSIFSDENGNFLEHDVLGRYLSLKAGFAPSTRLEGSSGGVITWLLCHLLESGQVDFVVHVAPRALEESDRGLSFGFVISSTPDAVRAGSTSFYYPVSYADVIGEIRRTPGRYAVTGVPCFHKALRLLRSSDPVLDERIAFQVGLVCGQMKSANYFEYLLRRAEVPGRIASATFRRKDLAGRADAYFFEAVSSDGVGGSSKYQIANRQIGVNWGMGLFKPKACDFCDDVFAETADVAVMDGWLPRYVQDGRGTSLIVARSKVIDAILARENGKSLELEDVSAADMVESQAAGVKHRRQGLSYRLSIASGWVPRKRQVTGFAGSLIFRIEQRLRIVLRISSRFSMRFQIRFGRGLNIYNGMMFFPLLTYRLVQKYKRIRSVRN